MKKIVFGILAATLLLMSCEGNQPKEVDVKGNWKYSEHVKGSQKLNLQNESMVMKIVSVFKDGSIHYKEDGTLFMESPKIGKQEGTYTVSNGQLQLKLGTKGQFILHVQNEGDKLAILFNEDSDASIGKILLEKMK